MAIIAHIEKSNRSNVKLHPTRVTCRYTVGDLSAGKKVLQLETGGSDHREHPGKISQTLQLDENAARALWVLLGKEFGFKG